MWTSGVIAPTTQKRTDNRRPSRQKGKTTHTHPPPPPPEATNKAPTASVALERQTPSWSQPGQAKSVGNTAHSTTANRGPIPSIHPFSFAIYLGIRSSAAGPAPLCHTAASPSCNLCHLGVRFPSFPTASAPLRTPPVSAATPPATGLLCRRCHRRRRRRRCFAVSSRAQLRAALTLLYHTSVLRTPPEAEPLRLVVRLLSFCRVALPGPCLALLHGVSAGVASHVVQHLPT